MLPPLHAPTLDPSKMGDHLLSTCPYNAAVTTLSMTARISGPHLDTDVQILDRRDDHWCTGSTRFRNARVLRMRLKCPRGLRWITMKVFRNGTLHLTGPYAVDVAAFVVRRLTRDLNKLYLDQKKRYAYRMGNVLLTNYRLTVGKRVCLRAVAGRALLEGHIANLDPRETAVTVKILVDTRCWASARFFSTGSLVLSLPELPGRAREGALARVLAFVRLL